MVEAWSNRAPLSVLQEHFPSLHKGDVNGEMAAWCPCEHPDNAPVEFYAHEIEGQGWAIGFCDMGDAPSEIWRASKKPRSPGSDDGEQPTSFLELHRPHFTLEEVLADPKPRRYLLKDTRTGHGVMKQGELFMLAARGGIGKSNAFVQLGVSITSDRPWFGSGKGWQPQLVGPVLVVLAEEDREEALRRLHFAIKAAGIINPDEVRAVLERLHLLPVKGQDVSLCEPIERGVIAPTPVAGLILSDLKRAALAGRAYVAVLLDPLADLSGPDAETDNAAGKMFVKVLNRFTAPDCGAPSVGITHHLRKAGKDFKRDDSDIDAVRGASAITNGIRWVCVIDEKEPDHFILRVQKVNYGKKPEPLHLGKVAECEGMLLAIDPPAPKVKEEPAARDIGLENKILDTLERKGRGGKEEIAGRLGIRAQNVRQAIDRMFDAGMLVKDGRHYNLPPEARPQAKVVQLAFPNEPVPSRPNPSPDDARTLPDKPSPTRPLPHKGEDGWDGLADRGGPGDGGDKPSGGTT